MGVFPEGHFWAKNGGFRTPPKTRVFRGSGGPKKFSFKHPSGGVLRPVGPSGTAKKVEKGPRGAVFSLFSKISPPVMPKIIVK